MSEINQFICESCPIGTPFQRPAVTVAKTSAMCEKCGKKMRRITGKGRE